MLAFSFLQKVRDDWRRYRVDELRARVVTQQQSGELIIFDQRNGVTVLAVLHRQTNPIGEELANVGRILRHLNRRDQTLGCYQRAGRFQLPRGNSITDYCVAGDIERRNSFEEILVGRFEQGEVRFVIDHRHVGRIFLAGFSAFQLNVVLV